MPNTPAEKQRQLMRSEAKQLLIDTTPSATSREIFRAQANGQSMLSALTGGVANSQISGLGHTTRKIGGEPAPVPPLPSGADNKARNAEDRLGAAIGATSLHERLSVLKPFEPKMLT